MTLMIYIPLHKASQPAGFFNARYWHVGKTVREGKYCNDCKE
jgi:hypothetical protein